MLKRKNDDDNQHGNGWICETAIVSESELHMHIAHWHGMSVSMWLFLRFFCALSVPLVEIVLCTRMDRRHITIGIMSPFPLSAMNRLSNTNAITFYGGAYALQSPRYIHVLCVGTVVRFLPAARIANGKWTDEAKRERENCKQSQHNQRMLFSMI